MIAAIEVNAVIAKLRQSATISVRQPEDLVGVGIRSGDKVSKSAELWQSCGSACGRGCGSGLNLSGPWSQ